MATGVEVVGLALGVVPLVVSGIEHYRKALEPFGIWARYRKDLSSLKEILDLEMAKFLNTIQLLLAPLLSPPHLARIIEQPQGPHWLDWETQQQLVSRLGYSYGPFSNAVRDFHEAMYELYRKFSPQPDANLPREVRKRLEHELDRIKYSFSRERRNQLKQTLKRSNKAMHELVTQTAAFIPAKAPSRTKAIALKRIGKTAEEVHGALARAPWSCQCSIPHLANLVLENRHDQIGALVSAQNQWPRFKVVFCIDEKKPHPHSDWRETEIVPLPTAENDTVDAPTSGVKFSTSSVSTVAGEDSGSSAGPPMLPPLAVSVLNPNSSSYPNLGNTTVTVVKSPRNDAENVVDVKSSLAKKKARKSLKWDCSLNKNQSLGRDHLSGVPERQALKPIVNLCATLQLVAEGSKQYLGTLETSTCQKFGILPVKRHPRGQILDHTLKLEDLMLKPGASDNQLGNKCSQKPPYHLSEIDKRYLATCLASTLLQLHNTSWLNRRLERRNILFLRELSECRKPIIEQPLVSRPFMARDNFESLSSRPADSVICPPSIRNKAVFDLGILLIELCFRQPLYMLRTPEDLNADSSLNAFTDLTTAERLLDRVYSKAGARYGDAVRRCIRCQFDQRDETFENEEFLEAVYQLVVVPLEDDLRDFCGGKLPSVGSFG